MVEVRKTGLLAKDIQAIAFILFCALIIWIPRIRGPIDLRYDAGIYYVLGTSLAGGAGYRLPSEPGDIRAIQYPPLLPAFVAAHQVILGGADPARVGPWLRASSCLLTTLYLLATYAMARQFLPEARSALVALIVAFHVQTTFLSDILFAEIPFALMTVLLVALRGVGGKSIGLAMQAMTVVTAFLIRSAGIAVLAAWVAEALLQKRWRRAIGRGAVALAPLVAWQAYVARVQVGDDYRHPAYAYQRASYQYSNVSYAENMRLVDPFVPELGVASSGVLARRVVANLAAMPASLGECISSPKGFWYSSGVSLQRVLGVDLIPRGSWPVVVMLMALGGLSISGVGLLWARRERLIPCYLVASLALICTTPWPGQLLRYLTPLTPFLGLSLVLSLGDFAAYTRRRWSGRRSRVGPAAMLLVLTVVFGGELLSLYYSYRMRQDTDRGLAAREGGNAGRLLFYDQAWSNFEAALTWLEGRLGPGDVIATTWPHWAYLRTGAKSVMPPMEQDPETAQRLLDSVPARYLIIDEIPALDFGRRYGVPVVEHAPESWRLVHTVPGSSTRVYRRGE